MILHDGKVGGWVALKSIPWRHGKKFFVEKVLHNKGTPTFGTQPKVIRLSNEAMFFSFYLSLSHPTL